MFMCIVFSCIVGIALSSSDCGEINPTSKNKGEAPNKVRSDQSLSHVRLLATP